MTDAHDHDHDRGLAFDLSTLLNRRRMLTLLAEVTGSVAAGFTAVRTVPV
jgi:hypothetical protein